MIHFFAIVLIYMHWPKVSRIFTIKYRKAVPLSVASEKDYFLTSELDIWIFNLFPAFEVISVGSLKSKMISLILLLNGMIIDRYGETYHNTRCKK